jgi:hypothetical protein
LTFVMVYSMTSVLAPATHMSTCESSSDWLRSRLILKIYLRLAILVVLERLKILISE